MPVVLRHGGALLLGAAVALAAVADHRFATAGVPWGLALACVSSVLTCWWLRGSGHPRTATSYGAGWLVLFTVVVLARPEGDYALAADVPGYTMLALGLVVVAVSVSSLFARSPENEPPRT